MSDVDEAKRRVRELLGREQRCTAMGCSGMATYHARAESFVALLCDAHYRSIGHRQDECVQLADAHTLRALAEWSGYVS